MFDKLLPIIQGASSAILEIYHSAKIESEDKEDGSPITLADTASNNIICNALSKMEPFNIVSEETSVSYAERRGWKSFWLVDPLDGTKDFIAKNDEFTINIAIIKDEKAVLGLVAAPALGCGYYAEEGQGAYKFSIADGQKSKISNNRTGMSNLIGARSRFHGLPQEDEFFAKYGIKETRRIGSALKLCQIAEGLCDVYPRYQQTKEWDTAAGQCILEEGNGKIISLLTEKPLRYNKEDIKNGSFIACRKNFEL